MNINISGHHLDITDALKSRVMDSISGKLKHFVKLKIISVDVILSVDNFEHKAEASLKMAGIHQPLISQGITKDMYASINKMADTLERQLQKVKEKMQDHGDTELM